MMILKKIVIFSFIFCVRQSCFSQSQTIECYIDRDSNYTMSELGSIYIKLRTNGEDCDNWGSGLHYVLSTLLDSIVAQKIGYTNVMSIMGLPDKVCRFDSCTSYLMRRNKTYIIYRTKTKYFLDSSMISRNEMLAVYNWRAGHDYIRLFYKNNRLIRGDWYFAGD